MSGDYGQGWRDALAVALAQVDNEARRQIELMKRDPAEQWGHSVQRLNVVANYLRQLVGSTPPEGS